MSARVVPFPHENARTYLGSISDVTPSSAMGLVGGVDALMPILPLKDSLRSE